MSFCLCVYRQENSVYIKDGEGSVSGYLQTNSLYDVGEFELTKIFLNQYLYSVKDKYRSAIGSDLGLMKCVDFSAPYCFNGKELDDETGLYYWDPEFKKLFDELSSLKQYLILD